MRDEPEIPPQGETVKSNAMRAYEEAVRVATYRGVPPPPLPEGKVLPMVSRKKKPGAQKRRDPAGAASDRGND